LYASIGSPRRCTGSPLLHHGSGLEQHSRTRLTAKPYGSDGGAQPVWRLRCQRAFRHAASRLREGHEMVKSNPTPRANPSASTKRKAPSTAAANQSAGTKARASSASATGLASVRMYRQGLGDCFLITLPKPNGDPWRMLIDCGVILGTPDVNKRLLEVIANVVE